MLKKWRRFLGSLKITSIARNMDIKIRRGNLGSNRFYRNLRPLTSNILPIQEHDFSSFHAIRYVLNIVFIYNASKKILPVFMVALTLEAWFWKNAYKTRTNPNFEILTHTFADNYMKVWLTKNWFTEMGAQPRCFMNNWFTYLGWAPTSVNNFLSTKPSNNHLQKCVGISKFAFALILLAFSQNNGSKGWELP